MLFFRYDTHLHLVVNFYMDFFSRIIIQTYITEYTGSPFRMGVFPVKGIGLSYVESPQHMSALMARLCHVLINFQSIIAIHCA